jgi:hypothetical protein
MDAWGDKFLVCGPVVTIPRKGCAILHSTSATLHSDSAMLHSHCAMLHGSCLMPRGKAGRKRQTNFIIKQGLPKLHFDTIIKSWYRKNFLKSLK